MMTHMRMLAMAVVVSLMPLMGWSAQCETTSATLSDGTKAAITEALIGPAGEYASEALYSAMIKRHGELRPYIMIRASEGRHASMLVQLLEKYGVPVPANPFAGKEGETSAGETLRDAAKLGIESEKKNIAMYERLLPKVKEYEDVTAAFNQLLMMSRDHHLQAFTRAAGQGGSMGQGQGGHGDAAGQAGGGHGARHRFGQGHSTADGESSGSQTRK